MGCVECINGPVCTGGCVLCILCVEGVVYFVSCDYRGLCSVLYNFECRGLCTMYTVSPGGCVLCLHGTVCLLCIMCVQGIVYYAYLVLCVQGVV